MKKRRARRTVRRTRTTIQSKKPALVERVEFQVKVRGFAQFVAEKSNG